MSTYDPTQEFFLPETESHERDGVRTAALVSVTVLAVVALAILIAAFAQGRFGSGAAEVAFVGEISEPAPAVSEAEGGLRSDGDLVGAGTSSNEVPPVPVGPAPIDESTDSTDEGEPTGEGETTPEVEGETTPEVEGELTDEEEDAHPDAPDVGDVPDGTPAQPLPEGPDPVPPAPADPEVTPLDPAPTEPVDDPCAPVLADGENLLVERPILLDKGVLTSSLTVHNCGDASVNWTAATKPWVALANEAGNLGPHSSTDLAFTIDRDAVDTGAFTFKIKVSEPGSNTYVDVSGFRALVGSDVVATDQLTAGEGAGGCANSCIRRAELSSHHSTTAVTLDVATTVPAAVNVWVSTQAPTPDGDGEPSLPGVGLAAFSPGQITEWSANLDGLAAATKYHIVVEAIDGNGKRTVEAGTFTTVTPVAHPGDFKEPGPGGCANQCIQSGEIHAGHDPHGFAIDVGTTVDAVVLVFVSADNVAEIDGVPSFPSIAASATSGAYVTEFSEYVSGLEPETHYNVIVQASDVNGHTAHRLASFTTGPAPVVVDPTFDVVIAPLKLTVTHDADKVGRGELRFAWSVGESFGSRGEERMNNGDSFGFDNAQYHFSDLAADDFLPQVAITAFERDWDGLTEFDTTGTGPFLLPLYGRIDSCDCTYNTSTGGFVGVSNVEQLPRCEQFGIEGAWADHACMKITTVDHGQDFARFDAIVAVQVAADIPTPVPGS